MPRIQIGAKQAARSNDWRQAVLDQLRSGKVLPIISNRLHNDLLLGGHKELVRYYAEHYRVAPDSDCDLPAAAQYNRTTGRPYPAHFVPPSVQQRRSSSCLPLY